MKSMKKLASCLFALLLGVTLCGVPALAFADVNVDSAVSASIADGAYVIDEEGLISSSDEASLNQKAASVQSSYDVAPYFITARSLEGYSSLSEFTNAYVEAYQLDSQASNGCVVFMLSTSERSYWLTSYGNAGSSFPQSTIDYLDSDIFPYLGRSDWAGAADTFFGDVGQTLGGGKANATSDVSYKGTYVTDAYGLFTDEQRASLEAKATELAQKYQMGVYLLVVDYMNGNPNPSSSERTNFATSFYRANNLGLGSGKDGIMLVIAVDSRDYVTIAYGQGSYSFSDEGIRAMEEAVTEELGNNDWYGGSNAYYDKTGEELEYYSVKGEPWTEPDPLSFLLKILAILGIPASVAFSKTKSDKAAMKTAREQTEASSYLDRGSFNLLESHDQFVNTTLAVTPIPKHEDRDSGSGFGGGGWGGGGGGGFSSSGGGKF